MCGAILWRLSVLLPVLFGTKRVHGGEVVDVNKKEPWINIEYPREGDILRNISFIPVRLNFGNFELGRDGLICFNVLRDMGGQSFCDNHRRNEWHISGLSTGLWALRVSLIDDHTEPHTKKVERSVRFELELEEKQLPVLAIQFPRENETVTNSVIEISLYVNHFPEGFICLAMGDLPKFDSESPWCFDAKQAVIRANAPQSGEYTVRAQLYDKNGNQVHMSTPSTFTTFHVQLPPPQSGLKLDEYGTLAQGAPIIKEEWKTKNTCGKDEIKGSCLPTTNKARNEAVRLEKLHIMVMSYQSIERYKETTTMIKSILQHHRRKREIHFHLITDIMGVQFFQDHLIKYDIPCLGISYYDFEATCVKHTDSFLNEFSFNLSFHHSGKAGYCRLFVPEMFGFLSIPRMIAIDTDQLFFRDIEDLWNEFAEFTDDAMVGMVEMYRFWQEGRKGWKKGLQKRILNEHLFDRYHGNGFMAGVIMYDFERMRFHGWNALWKQILNDWIQLNEGWHPQLSEQDVLNAVFTLRPSLVYVVPCEWNLQYHVLLSSILLCGQGVFNCQDSLDKGIFFCPQSPAIVHYGAQSYNSKVNTLYTEFWHATEKLPIYFLRATHQACLHAKKAAQY